MQHMRENYGRDLDLNLLRVFVVVAEQRSVTQAAARLYLTQPAVSAALRRLAVAVGAPLFARQGRGLALTARGERLLATARTHLVALVDAALAPAAFDPRTSERTIRLGASDATELWLLPALLRVLAHDAPRMRVIAIPVNFRTVGDAFTTQRLDAAITVADELPPAIRRAPLHKSGFCCVFDPRGVAIRRLGVAEYFAHDHVAVSYNGDLRGIVEDALGKQRSIRCSVSSFANLGVLLDGSALLATVPERVAHHLRRVRPHLAVRKLPFALPTGTSELLWPSTLDDDAPSRFVRERIQRIAASPPRTSRRRERRSARPRARNL
jgi:LysR family transcriptional regulator, mexEF-oprN operon transcriptional activator